jgi:hypothetical protein
MVHDHQTVIIAAVFHEKMDIPTRLRELQTMSKDEIKALKQDMARSKS